MAFVLEGQTAIQRKSLLLVITLQRYEGSVHSGYLLVHVKMCILGQGSPCRRNEAILDVGVGPMMSQAMTIPLRVTFLTFKDFVVGK